MIRDLRLSKRALASALLFILTFSIYALTASRSTTSIDVYDTALASWKIAETGDPWLEGFDLESLDKDTDLISRFISTADNGHLVVDRSPGPVAAGILAYSLAQVDEFTLWPQAILAALLTALGVLLLFWALLGHLPITTSLVSALVFAFGTPVWSVAADGMWPHTLTVLGLCGMAWAASRKKWVLVGLLGGVALWGRVHAAMIVAILGLGAAWTHRRPSVAVRAGLASAAFMGAASIWTHWMYGRWSPTGGYNSGDVLSRVRSGDSQGPAGLLANELGMWVAPDRGILVWTPLFLLLLPALIRSWRGLPDWTRWMFVGGLAYTIAQAWYSPFHGGDAFFGYRLGLEFLACATPALACSHTSVGTRARLLTGPVVGLQVAVFTLGSAANGLFLGQEEAWRDNVIIAAAREVPLLWGWLALGAVVGAVAQRALGERALRTIAMSESVV